MMVKDEIDIEDLFNLYHFFCKETSGNKIDISKIDCLAFVEALNCFFYNTSISINQQCWKCGKKIGHKAWMSKRTCSKCTPNV